MRLLTLLSLLFIGSLTLSASAVPDSISFYVQNGIRIVIHEVEKGETLEEISKKYHVSIEDILKYNPDIRNGMIREGQIVKVPRSKGQESSSGKDYRIHRVEKGETLYAIARKYNVPVGQIIRLNTGIDPDRLREGQELKIPITPEDQPGQVEEKEKKEKKENKNVKTEDKKAPSEENKEYETVADGEEEWIYHTVEPGETMYAISRKYKVRVTDIMDWNGLKTFTIDAGQKLKVGKKETEAHSPREVSEEKTGSGEKAQNKKSEEAQEIKKETPPEEEGKKEEDFVAAVNELSLEYEEMKSSPGYREESEKAVTRWMKDVEGFPASKGYFALHRTLPIGTIIKVENPVNGRYIYAKVIGHLPARAENKDIQMKLPESAGQELKAYDDIALLEIFYLKEKKGRN